MQQSLKRYLLFISFCILLIACTSQYRKMQKTNGDIGCIEKFRPVFNGTVYHTKVDVVGKHLSGLLVIKKMPDSSMRIVFTSEIGFKFFDFGFSKDSGFKVYYILPQMDKKAVIKTLRKDFELVMMYNTTAVGSHILKDKENFYYAFPQEKGLNYYVVDSACSELRLMQRSSKRKAVVEAIMQQYNNGVPDTIGITHKNFNFTIGLKRVEKK
ncbi:MAG: hypothetical protein JST75_07340 [Bacteroidetes bacterium]|nr:hypothetical protein [Bacteroidota bacterium]